MLSLPILTELDKAKELYPTEVLFIPEDLEFTPIATDVSFASALIPTLTELLPVVFDSLPIVTLLLSIISICDPRATEFVTFALVIAH